jgi:molecular chaperone GrpE
LASAKKHGSEKNIGTSGEDTVEEVQADHIGQDHQRPGLDEGSGEKTGSGDHGGTDSDQDREKGSKHKRQHRGSAEDLADLLSQKNDMLQELKEKLARNEEALKLKEDKILRMAAEFENYKKRTRREWELLQSKANAELLGRVIEVLDDFDRALAAMEGEGDHFVDGIRMIHAGLIDVLGRSGLSEIEALGKVFDPNFHEAIAEAESEEVEPGCVLQVVQKGYMLHDHLLRPARVIVARASQAKS